MINDFLVVRGQFNTRLFEGGLFMVGIAPVPLNALWSSHNTYIQLNIDKRFEMCGHLSTNARKKDLYRKVILSTWRR